MSRFWQGCHKKLSKGKYCILTSNNVQTFIWGDPVMIEKVFLCATNRENVCWTYNVSTVSLKLR